MNIMNIMNVGIEKPEIHPRLEMGLDSETRDYLDKNPQVAEAFYNETHAIGRDFEVEKARIEEEELREEMAVEKKAFSLLTAWTTESDVDSGFDPLLDRVS
jgi:hypothetical protein